MSKAEKKINIVWHKLDPGEFRADLERNISRFEAKFAMDSMRMLEQLSAGEVEETDEILEWMQDFHVVRYLDGEIRIPGTRGKTTVPSTKSD